MADKKFLNVKKLAEYLDVSTYTIYFWVSQRKIPHYKIGKHLKFIEEEIEKWLKERKIEPTSF